MSDNAGRKYTIVIDEHQRLILTRLTKAAADSPPYSEEVVDLAGMFEHLPEIDTQDDCVNDFTQ